MDRKLGLVIFIVAIVLSISTVLLAQDDVCSVDFTDLLDTVSEVCVSTGRNQICYGNTQVNAIPQPNVIDFAFAMPGDISDVAKVKSMSLSALDESSGIWGVAVMKLLANLSAEQLEDVSIVLFGDVEIEDAVVDRTELEATVNTSVYINMRRRPSTNVGPVGALAPRSGVIANGRLADSSWIRVTEPVNNISGWVSADLLRIDGDVESLLVEEPEAPFFGPMQAFYFNGGSTSCGRVPLDGMLIQTPEGVGRVSLWVNEITIDFLSTSGGSTALITQPQENDMVIQVLEGSAIVGDANVGTVLAPAGSEVHIPLNPDGTPSGPPSTPISYDVGDIPIIGVDRPIEIAPPADPEVIIENNPGMGCEGEDCPPTDGECSGNSCNAPGRNPNDCRGNSCDAPGRTGQTQGNNSGGNNNSCQGNSCGGQGNKGK